MPITDTSSPVPKGRRKKKAAPVAEDVEVVIADPVMPAFNNPDSGVVTIPHSDGSVTIALDGEASISSAEEAGPTKHNDNLVKFVSENEQTRIAEELLEAIKADKQDRSSWEQMRAKSLEIAGFRLEDPKSDVSTSTTGVSMSVVRDTVVGEAALNFQATSFGELCPSSGPVKVRSFDDKAQKDQLAQALEDDLNYYFTTTASEYYPDTRGLLLKTGLYSGMFKKVYSHPIKRRPVSESVDGIDLILPANATDVKSAGRVTHEVTMRPAIMRRMQLLGVYADIALGTPIAPSPNAVEQKEAQIGGIQAQPQREEDQDYTVFECYCELDIQGFEHEEDGEPTGLPLPYRVTIEDTSRKILEIRRNWAEDDEDFQAKIPFVLFPYATGLGIYGMGLGQILGNVANSLTALTREAIDLLMFNNFPGFLYAKTTSRQLSNEFRIAPGSGMGMDTGGAPIRDAAMPLPYPQLSSATITFMEQLRSLGQRLGGTANAPVGEGKQDAPVGTTLALIEQATKVEGAVHKALHAAQSEEFNLIIDLFKEDPEALWRGNRRPALGKDKEERVARFKQALEDWAVVPQSDPNTPSQMHRYMKAMAMIQLNQAFPGLYDPKLLNIYVGDMLKLDTQSVMAPPAPQQGPPPELLLEIERLKQGAAKLQLEDKKIGVTSRDKAADREAKQNIEVFKIAQAIAVHPESDPLVDDQLAQMAPWLHPDTVTQGGVH